MKNITNEEILILNQNCLQNTKIILHKNNMQIIFVIFVSITITVFFAYLCNNIML